MVLSAWQFHPEQNCQQPHHGTQLTQGLPEEYIWLKYPGTVLPPSCPEEEILILFQTYRKQEYSPSTLPLYIDQVFALIYLHHHRFYIRTGCTTVIHILQDL